jgi:hypothetical protein
MLHSVFVLIKKKKKRKRKKLCGIIIYLVIDEQQVTTASKMTHFGLTLLCSCIRIWLSLSFLAFFYYGIIVYLFVEKSCLSEAAYIKQIHPHGLFVW